MVPSIRRFRVPLTCQYLHSPGDSQSCLVITMHGYGQNAEDLLRLTRSAVGPGPAIISMQGPHPFSLRPFQNESPVGFNWGTSPVGWEEAIRLHHDMLLAVLADIEADPRDTFLAGFSQPVGMNYRFIATHPGCVRGVIGICGGVPKGWETMTAEKLDVSILHISRSEDEFYPVERVMAFPERLKLHAPDVEFHLIRGKHRFPSDADKFVVPWLARIRTAG